jgi:hypothetical protein
MGFFSFITQDSKKSIANIHSSRPAFTVYMTDNRGNMWKEDAYEGYGDFGGKDFYELVAEMNGLTTRGEGIELFHNKNKTPFLSPNLTESPNLNWMNKKPKTCPDQGFFYGFTL